MHHDGSPYAPQCVVDPNLFGCVAIDRVPLQTHGRQVERFVGAAPPRRIGGSSADPARRNLPATDPLLVIRNECDSCTSHPVRAHPEDIKVVPGYRRQGRLASLFPTPRPALLHDGLVACWHSHVARKAFSSIRRQRPRRGSTSADQGQKSYRYIGQCCPERRWNRRCNLVGKRTCGDAARMGMRTVTLFSLG